MRYFPFQIDRFEHQFGIRALKQNESVIEVTDHYADEIALKREALATDRSYYYRSNAIAQSAEREVLDLIVASAPFLSGEFNSRLEERFDADEPSPLVRIGRHVQEDLTVVSGDASNGHPLIAGFVTFPSGWCIGDKIGNPMLEIHDPVPEYDTVLHPPTEKLMGRIKVDRPVWRMNWGIRASDQLDQSPKHTAHLNGLRDRVNPENAGQCYLRVERQTLARLPQSGHILFAIHTHQCKLDQLAPKQKQTLLGVLASAPEATLRYKGIWPILSALTQWLG